MAEVTTESIAFPVTAKDGLNEILKSGAQQMLATAIEVEVAEWIDTHAHLTNEREVYQRTLNTLGIECSVSRIGNCCDNAVMERFFWFLKHEWAKHASAIAQHFRTPAGSG